MPDLPSFNDIDKIIRCAPHILKFVVKETLKRRDQRITAAELPIKLWPADYFFVDIKHGTTVSP